MVYRFAGNFTGMGFMNVVLLWQCVLVLRVARRASAFLDASLEDKAAHNEALRYFVITDRDSPTSEAKS
jgi:hypothetical protein